MAQGKKHSDEVREKAFALLATTDNVSEVAETLGLSRTTVNTWKKKWERESAEAVRVSQDTAKNAPDQLREQTAGVLAHETEDSPCSENLPNNTPTDTHDLVKLRQQKKETFVNKSWDMIERTQRILEKRIIRAEEQEKKIDALIEDVEKNTLGWNKAERNALFAKLDEIKLESAKSLAVLLGTLYDKQALATKEPTVNLGGSVSVKKFEDEFETL